MNSGIILSSSAAEQYEKRPSISEYTMRRYNLFTWNSVINLSDNTPYARLSYNWLRETGTITMASSNLSYRVVHKCTEAEWYLLPPGRDRLPSTPPSHRRARTRTRTRTRTRARARARARAGTLQNYGSTERDNGDHRSDEAARKDERSSGGRTAPAAVAPHRREGEEERAEEEEQEHEEGDLGPSGDSDERERPVAAAQQIHASRRHVVFYIGDKVFRMRRDSAFDAENVVLSQPPPEGNSVGEVAGILTCTHFFFRSHALHFDSDVPHMLPAFCMWMTALFDRRNAKTP